MRAAGSIDKSIASARLPDGCAFMEGYSMAIRVGIIGRNFVVDWMLAAMEQEPELCPGAIYSRNEETGREFAKKHHFDAVFTHL